MSRYSESLSGCLLAVIFARSNSQDLKLDLVLAMKCVSSPLVQLLHFGEQLVETISRLTRKQLLEHHALDSTVQSCELGQLRIKLCVLGEQLLQLGFPFGSGR